MGLITNPTTRRKLVHFISSYNSLLCFVCYVAGLVWFLALAHSPFNAKTYFSENALLPGLVDRKVSLRSTPTDYLNELKAVFDNLKTRDTQTNPVSRKIPADWLEASMRKIGIDTFVQNFSFEYPDGIFKDQIFHGQNVYGILRAPRAASTEALVMSAPYRPLDVPDKTAGGIALMLSMAKGFRKNTYWAKDIIFLVTEYDQIGMKAWLDAYHHSPSSYIHAGELIGRSGAIQAAINLEIPGDTISKLNLKIEGLNGQLPNLDLINTVVRLSQTPQIPTMLHKRNDPKFRTKEYLIFKHSLTTMLSMMATQATGVASGNHGLFLPFHIEALTIQGVKMKNAKDFGFHDMGVVVEGVFRSLNNLLERFHQSFFFYLLPATDRYVSIGLYMPPFGLMVIPLVIRALALWIASTNSDLDEAKSAETKKETKDKKNEEETKDKKEDNNSMLSLIPVLLLAVFFGWLTFSTPRFFIESSDAIHMPPTQGVIIGSLAIFIAELFFPYILRRRSSFGSPDARLLKCVGLLSCALLLGASSLMNISLAFFLGALWTPVLVTANPRTNWFSWFIQAIVLIIASPLGILILSCLVNQQLIQSKPPTDLHGLADAVTTSASQSLLTMILDLNLLGNWLFAFASFGLVPIWAIFWELLWTKPKY